MKKTISINLGSSLFYAEDDAYRRLDDYLREVEKYFAAHGDDSAEILRDIESSLAEQFINGGAGELKRALSLGEVEAALKNMGTITDFSAEDQNLPVNDNQASENNKRFYRDSDDVIIAGVCSGLGHYFGLDPVWVRLIFALSIFFWGFGVWIYFIIWIAAPSAKTAAQKLAMQGEAVNLSSLSAQLKENLQGEKIKKAGSGAIAALEKFLKKLFSLFGRIIRSAFRLLVLLLSLAIVAFSLFAFCAIAFLGVAAIFSGRQYLEPGLVSVLGWPYPWLAASATLAVALPFLALFMLGLMMMRKKNFLPAAFWLSLLGLWFISFLGAGAIGSAAYARVRPYVSEQKSESIALAGEIEKLEISGPYYLQIIPGEVISLQAEGHPADLADIEASLVDGKLSISKKPTRDWLCFNCGHSVRLTLSVPSSFKEASVGDRAVLNVEAWQGEELKLSFSGASGGNIAADLKVLHLSLSDMADVDLVGGNLEKLLISADDYSSFDSGRAVVRTAEISLAGAARISLNAK
ncbi:MAG: PspC domain-containing protein, partial [Patescibacteria group bacterium]|nr:PspC domain-containing protein [Patescibacteria group bacterium]